MCPWAPVHELTEFCPTGCQCTRTRGRPGTARAQCTQRVHGARTTHICQGEIGGFCYYWQYSCLYRPYYTPPMLDSLMFPPPGADKMV